jgi:uncharacterized membrane protein
MMTTDVLDRVPVERISERARQVNPGRVALTVIAVVLFGLGWVTFKAFAGAWFVAAWCGSAVAEGWIAAKAGQRAGVS